MATNDLESILADLRAAGLEPPPPEVAPAAPEFSGFQNFLGGLAGLAQPPMVRPRGFGGNFGAGFNQALGSAGARVQAQKAKFEEDAARRRALADQARIAATQTYRKAVFDALQGERKKAGEQYTVTPEDVSAAPKGTALARLKPGTQISRSNYEKALLESPPKEPKVDLVPVQGPDGSVTYQPKVKGAVVPNKGQDAGTTFDPHDFIEKSPSGVPIINTAGIPDKKKQQIAAEFGRSNKIAVIGDRQKKALDLLEEARGNLDSIETSASGFLPGSALTRTVVGPLNTLAGMTQANPEIAGFKAYRTAAINAIQAIAGLGTGLRINQAEIQAALKNDIPTITDTKDVARVKLNNLRNMLDHVEESAVGGKLPTEVTVNGTTYRFKSPHEARAFRIEGGLE